MVLVKQSVQAADRSVEALADRVVVLDKRFDSSALVVLAAVLFAELVVDRWAEFASLGFAQVELEAEAQIVVGFATVMLEAVVARVADIVDTAGIGRVEAEVHIVARHRLDFDKAVARARTVADYIAAVAVVESVEFAGFGRALYKYPWDYSYFVAADNFVVALFVELVAVRAPGFELN